MFLLEIVEGEISGTMAQCSVLSSADIDSFQCVAEEEITCIFKWYSIIIKGQFCLFLHKNL